MGVLFGMQAGLGMLPTLRPLQFVLVLDLLQLRGLPCDQVAQLALARPLLALLQSDIATVPRSPCPPYHAAIFAPA